MKISGAVLILAACLSAGNAYIRQRQRKLLCLCELCRCLNILKGELATNLLPLPRLFELTAERVEGECSEFFSVLASSLCKIDGEDLSSVWERTAYLKLDLIGDDELRLFSSLGCVLGKFQLDEQLSALESAIAELQTSLLNCKSAFSAQKKLSFGLSTAGGLLILIILI